MANPTQVEFLIERIAYNSSNQEEYHGWARPKTLDSEPRWIIKKTIYNTTKLPISTGYVNGSLGFEAIWDNRASLAYF